ncbi:MAG: decarboxylase, partial [Blautia sp.]|nr:decarboxylase [Blautia sp.]
EERLSFFSSVYQTSSPSYLLLESLDRCVEYGRVRAGADFAAYVKILDWAREEIEGIPGITLITPQDCFAFDRSKILLSATSLGIGGGELMSLLREDHLELEMEAEEYCLALSSVGDTKESFLRLIKSLQRISRELGKEKKKKK